MTTKTHCFSQAYAETTIEAEVRNRNHHELMRYIADTPELREHHQKAYEKACIRFEAMKEMFESVFLLNVKVEYKEDDFGARTDEIYIWFEAR